MSLYGFAYSKSALKTLRGLSAKHRKQVREKIEKLSDDPYPQSSKLVQGASMNGQQVYRVRSGDYRVLYSVKEGPQIVVIDIGHRKNIYRGF